VIAALLAVVYGEQCARCGADRGRQRWSGRGPRVPGLRPWDAPHLCAACADELAATPIAAHLVGDLAPAPPIFAARKEEAVLVDLVGALKYRGLRGLAWPLGRLMIPAAKAGLAATGPVDALVALPLHPRRRRSRGFNQADVLARVVAHELGLPVHGAGLRRQRATDQQAALAAGDATRRRDNVAGAFVASTPPTGEATRVALVDDLITTGATWSAAARALEAAGWDVRWGLALGVAARLAALDTVGAGL
jgi:predicted amidophosphoribosyltransferase